MTEKPDATLEVATEKPVVAASLVLHSGGGAHQIIVRGRKGRHTFIKRQGVGQLGKHAHVLEFTEGAEFERVEEDLRFGRPVQIIVAKIGAAQPWMSNVRPPSEESEPETEAETESEEDGGEESAPPVNEKKAARERELRRMGEEYVRAILTDGLVSGSSEPLPSYHLEGVPKLNNLEGMIAAILAHEEGLGLFVEEKPTETGTQSEPVKSEQTTNPESTPTPATHTHSGLMRMPMPDLHALANSMSVAITTRKKMAEEILAKCNA